MSTTTLQTGDARALDEAQRIFLDGGLVAFPTDTVYGLGSHAFLPEAAARLYAVKGRPAHQAIPLLLPDARAMEIVCADIPGLAWVLAERFWPGPLSLVLRRKDNVPDVVAAGGATVAVRVPDHPVVVELCRRIGAPLAATSANLHGHADAVTAAQVRRQLGCSIPLILDGGACSGGQPSTLLDLTVSPPRILRPGPVSPRALSEVVSLAT